MAKEFSDDTSKKQYKTMPEKKHPEKTVKNKTNENLQRFLEKKISEMVDDRIQPKMTMFSDEAPMELPIGKMFSIGKK